MFFVTPLQFEPYVHPTSSAIFSEDQYLDALTERAAHEYAIAHARAQTIRLQRHRNHIRSYSGHDVMSSLYHGLSDIPPRSPFNSLARGRYAHPLEELAYGAQLEQARRHAIAHQRDVQRARALAEAAAREDAARRMRAHRIHEQRAQAQEALFALLGLGAVPVPAQPAPAFVALQVNMQQQPVTFVPHQFVPIVPPALTPTPTSQPIDRKGKGKAVEIPVQVSGSPIPVTTTIPAPAQHPTLKEELETRIRYETDPDVQESLVLLYSDLFDARQARSTQPVAGPSGTKHEHYQIPVTASQPSPSPVIEERKPATSPADPSPNPESVGIESEADAGAGQEAKSAGLHRTPALPPAIAAKLLDFYRARRARKLSLAQIAEIETALRKLEGAFEFPAHLDFTSPSPSPSRPLTPTAPTVEGEAEGESEPGALAYTPNNTPVHAYENTLNALLTRLDAVESNGDLAVRGRRKEVVREVERALEAMERRVEESRERERSRDRARRASFGSDSEITVRPEDAKTENVLVAAQVEETLAAATEVASAEVELQVPIKAEDTSLATETASDDASDTLVKVEPFPDDAAPDSSSGCECGRTSPSEDIRGGCDLTVLGVEPDASASGFARQVVSSPIEPETFGGAPVADRVEITPSNLPSELEVAVARTNEGSAPTPEPEILSELSAEASEESFVPAVVPAAPAAEGISRVESSASDAATFVTADTFPSPLSITRSSSASSAGENTFLLSSTSAAEGERKQPRLSSDDSEDELEIDIINKDELEAVKNDSDWSDVESEPSDVQDSV